MRSAFFVALAALLSASVSTAHALDNPKTWDQIVAAAKAEGKVVVMNSPDPVMKNEIIPKFREKFGIQVEAIFGDTGTLAERAKLERGSGTNSVDVFMVGVGTALFILEPAKMLAPVKPLLTLPEVTDGTKWKLG